MLLHILWGMLIGYLIAQFNFALFLLSKGYTSTNQIPDKE